jgi:hypothetical protein
MEANEYHSAQMRTPLRLKVVDTWTKMVAHTPSISGLFFILPKGNFGTASTSGFVATEKIQDKKTETEIYLQRNHIKVQRLGGIP